ncbi:unnamed protein product [Arabidopsis lyrata]|uniref:Uncharacterized protein n=2 Tax=Arabidopsis lyrata TaxID=59689 RepID=D7KUY5_ARALL|nr:uncharacterized protein LOC9324636 [Arabidopsis lyrata subsp. lyrata]EFH64832.1 hypothetical protein ARALYDRAFT_475800 [Arabidopsis lyrata subsp. lyrata]CAH8257303.1 unnamed protein product [Arabidopsis lyrata]|eukprot:XP_020865625.1 uncharacterized protein LOC9324636 [Arabidopsis lyrata subsp. lyrata]
MAVDLLSENSNMSPRISFSRDFCQSDAIPIEKRPLRSSNSKPSSLNSSIDFDFCIPGGVNSGESFDQGSWSADELFSNGKILPTEIKKKPEPGKKEPESKDTKPVKTKPDSRKQRKQNEEQQEDDVIITTEEKTNTKSFWGFKRSSSLNCGSTYGRSLCPLPLLNRSNSTGSTSSKQKQSSSRKHNEHVKLQQSSSLSSSSSASSSLSNNGFSKPPLKKSYGGYSYGSHGGGGIRVSPVINVVPSGNLFGFGSMFSGNGRDKNKKR